MHQPGVTITLTDQIGLYVDYVYWQQKTAAGKATFDHSLNIVVSASL